MYILFVTSNHQFRFPQLFPRIFLSWSSWKRKLTFYWSKIGILSVLEFRPMKSLFSFPNPQTEKNSENKIDCLVVWCHKQDSTHCKAISLSLNIRFWKIFPLDTQCRRFQILLILDLWGISIHAVVVLVKNLI